MILHLHSSHGSFCRSKEQGRQFTLDPDKVTCETCLRNLRADEIIEKIFAEERVRENVPGK